MSRTIKRLFEISIIGVLVTIGLKYVLLNTVNTKDNINFEFPSMKHDVKQCLRMGTDKLALDDIMNMKPINFLQNYKNPCFKDPKGTLKCLPYFMLIGLDKSGTTDLFFKIVKHPDVLKNSGDLNGKETLWWSWKRYGYGYYWFQNKPMENLEKYYSYFKKAADIIETTSDNSGYHPMITCDGSVGDLWDFTGWPQIHQNRGLKEPKVLTPHLIKHLSPNTKFIIMLRDPIRRLHSDFHYWHFDGTSSEDFHRQVLESIGQLNDCTQKYSLRNCVFDRTFHCNVTVRLHLGMYWVFLQEWLKVFPKDQFLILRMENFIKDSKSTLKRIFKFLELRDVSNSDRDSPFQKPLYVNNMKKSHQILDKTKRVLKRFYQPSNKKLVRMLSDEQFLWES